MNGKFNKNLSILLNKLKSCTRHFALHEKKQFDLFYYKQLDNTLIALNVWLNRVYIFFLYNGISRVQYCL